MTDLFTFYSFFVFLIVIADSSHVSATNHLIHLRMEKYSRLYVSALLLAMVALNSACSEERATFTVKKSSIVEAVYSSIVVEPYEMYNVNASVPGYLDVLTAKIGDTVKSNDILFLIRDITSKNTASNALLAYELAQKNYFGDQNVLDDMRLELKSAELRKRNDSIQYQRIKALQSKDMATKFELEQSELVYSASKNNFSAIQNRIRRTERELKLSMEQAKNNFNSSSARSDESTVRSRVNGIVYDIYKEKGELVSMQEPVAVVGSYDRFSIQMLIDEKDITRVKIGQRIAVTLEAYPKKVFETVVKRITPKMDSRNQTFTVFGEFVNPPESLFMGLTGEGNIIVNQIDNAVVIPLEYLLEGNKVETPIGIIKVKTGVRSLSHVEILEGVKEGDLIYKPL